MVLPRTLPGPVGVSAGVWVHDQIKKVEHALDALARADLTLEQTERLERALTRAHQRNLERLGTLLEAEA